jgi:hypothetical protein
MLYSFRVHMGENPVTRRVVMSGPRSFRLMPRCRHSDLQHIHAPLLYGPRGAGMIEYPRHGEG